MEYLEHFSVFYVPRSSAITELVAPFRLSATIFFVRLQRRPIGVTAGARRENQLTVQR
jgi:hypothetical protein